MKDIKDLLVLKDKNLGEIYGRKRQTILDRNNLRSDRPKRKSERECLKNFEDNEENMRKPF